MKLMRSLVPNYQLHQALRPLSTHRYLPTIRGQRVPRAVAVKEGPGIINSRPFLERCPDSLRDMLDSQKNQSAEGRTIAGIEGA